MASKEEFAPLVKISNLSRFYWARFGFANEQVCHSQKDDAIDTFYDLLLQPELSPYLRALVNASLAIHADSRSLADRAKWVKEAKRLHENVKRWPKTIESDKYDGILHDTIKDAEEELRGEIEQLKLEASQEKEDAKEDDAEEMLLEDVEQIRLWMEKKNAEEDDAEEMLLEEVEQLKLEEREEKEDATVTTTRIITQQDDVEMEDPSDVESEPGALPFLPQRTLLDPHHYFPTPAPSSELGRTGNGNETGNGNGNGNRNGNGDGGGEDGHESNGSNGIS